MNPAHRNGKSALLLSGGTVIDGTGADRFVADVRIDGDRITAIGRDLVAPDAEVIDVAGLIVAPGFIDVHTHDDQIVLADPRMLPKITQGVTTVIVGNCGISLAPLVHADVPPPLNLLGGNDKYVYPTMAAYVAAVRARAARGQRRGAGRPFDAAGGDDGRSIPRGDQRRAGDGWSSCCAKAWTRARSACRPACSTRPAPPPMSMSLPCSPASPVRPAASTRRTSATR